MSILDVDVEMNLALYRRIRLRTQIGTFSSIHDISDGGFCVPWQNVASVI